MTTQALTIQPLSNLLRMPLKTVLGILLLLIGNTQLFSQHKDLFFNEISDKHFAKGDSFYVVDDRFRDESMQKVKFTKTIKNHIVFEVNDEVSHLASRPFVAEVKIRIDQWNERQDSIVTFKNMVISFDPGGTQEFKPRDVYYFSGVNEYKVVVEDIKIHYLGQDSTYNDTIPLLRLRGYTNAERLLAFNCSGDINNNISISYDNSTDRISVSWAAVDGASEYDLEYTFYDALSNFVSTGGFVNYNDLFKNNSTRIVTTQTSYYLPATFPHGYLFFRVRGAQYNIATDGSREYTNWSHPSGGAALAGLINKFQMITAHQANLNWQTEITFAEDAKNAQTIAYADGLPRVRQEVTLSRADNMVIVNEKIYDRLGRPAVNVLPTPAQNYPNALKFVPEFARDFQNNPYSADDFDLSNSCNYTINPMNTAYGPSWYYSPNNSKANITNIANPESVHRFVPDAEGYPFAVTEYTPDATGRIKRQGGLGPTFLASGTHAAQYFYGTTSSTELSRLFANNDVGEESHYQKNMVRDPNGQFSVSYVDPFGKTIATALAGDTPETLDQLSSANTIANTNINLLRNTLNGDQLISAYTLTVSKEYEHSFSYNLGGNQYEACTSTCFDCLYDLTITVTENCGNPTPLYTHTQTNITGEALPEACSTTPLAMSDIFSLNLVPGEYTITKTLKVSEQAVAHYAALYLEQQECLPSLQNLEALFSADVPGDCNISCAQCDSLLATLDSSSTWYAEYAKLCDQICQGENPRNYCDIYYDQLLADVSPGGQYLNIGDNNGECGPTTDPASLLFINPNTQVAPYQNTNLVYYEEDGTPSLISFDGVEITPNLLPPCAFLAHWKPSWAKTLVPLHPEYCLWQQCVSSGIKESTFLGDNKNTNVFLNNGQNIINLDPYFSSRLGSSQSAAMADYLTNFMNSGGTNYSLLETAIHLVTNAPLNNLPAYNTLCQRDCDAVYDVFVNVYIAKRFMLFVEALKNTACGNILDCIEVTTPCAAPNDVYASKIRRLVDPADPDIEDLFTPTYASAQDLIEENCVENCEYVAQAWIDKLINVGCTQVANLSQSALQALKDNFKNICTSNCDATHPYGAIGEDVNIALANALGITIGNCTEPCNGVFIGIPGNGSNPTWLGGSTSYFYKDSGICDKILSFEGCYNTGTTNYNSFLEYLNSFSDVKISQSDIDKIKNACADQCTTFDWTVKIPPQLDGKCRDYGRVNSAFDLLSCGSDALKAALLNRRFGLNLEYQDYVDFLNNAPPPGACQTQYVLCPKSIFPEVEVPDCAEEDLEIQLLAAQDAYLAEVEDRLETFKKQYRSNCLAGLTETFTTSNNLKEFHYTLYYYDRARMLVQTVPPDGVQVGAPTTHTLKTTYKYDCFGNNVERNTPDGGTTRLWYDYLGRPVVSQDAEQAAPSDQTPPRYSYVLYDGLGRTIETGEKRQSGQGAINNTIARNPVALNSWILENPTANLKDITRTYYDNTPINWASIVTGYTTLSNFVPENLRKRVASVVFMANYSPISTTLSPTQYDFATHYSYDIAGNVKTLVQDIRELENSGNNRYKRLDYEYDLVSGKVNRFIYQKSGIDQYIHEYLYDANNRLKEVNTGTLSAQNLMETETQYTYYHHGPLARVITGERNVQGTDYAYTLQGWIKGVNSSAMTPFDDPGSNIPEYLYLNDDPIASGEYKARTAVISEGRVPAGNDVTFKAGKFFRLNKPDFKVDLGGKFRTIIDPSLASGGAGDIIDMGRDGAPENNNIARDAFAYTISYYNGDYKKISQTGSGAGQTREFEASRNYGTLHTTTPNLYNGNIRYIAQQVRTLTASAFKYNYDQLQRLKGMEYWNKPNATGNWAPSDAYRESVTYDGNGNILTYLRNAADPSGAVQAMDNLSYQYYPNSNRLRRVADAVTANVFPDDIENQTNTNNYGYDRRGNLISDASKGTSFTWSMYGKVQSVGGLSNGGSLSYGYDAMQKRVMKTHTRTINGTVQTTRTFYIRDAQGNTLATYERSATALVLKEVELYGSARLGMYHANYTVWSTTMGNNTVSMAPVYLGRKTYEFSNHLGNVLCTVGDQRDQINPVNGTTFYDPRVLSAREYYPFGMVMPNRKTPAFGNSTYRYGFNGHEKEYEIDGNENYLLFEGFGYDSRLCRRLQIDPVVQHNVSGYAVFNNNPNFFVDIDGESPISVFAKAVAKAGLKKAGKEFIEFQIKKRLKSYSSKEWATQIGDDATAFLDAATATSWWEYAIEVVPVVGDWYGGYQLSKQGYTVWKGLERFGKLASNAATAATKAWQNISLSKRLTGKGVDALEKIVNRANNNGKALDDTHLAAAVKDIYGKPVPKSEGGVFDHLKEVNNSLAGLGNRIGELNKGLNDGTFSGDTKKAAEFLRKELQDRKDQITNVLNKAKKEAAEQ